MALENSWGKSLTVASPLTVFCLKYLCLRGASGLGLNAVSVECGKEKKLVRSSSTDKIGAVVDPSLAVVGTLRASVSSGGAVVMTGGRLNVGATGDRLDNDEVDFCSMANFTEACLKLRSC